QFIQDHYGPPNQYIWAFGIGGYVDMLPWGLNQQPGLTLNQVFAGMAQFLNTTFISDLQANAALAKTYNTRAVAYEGGQDLVPGANGLNYNVLLAAQSDPRMYQDYVT